MDEDDLDPISFALMVSIIVPFLGMFLAFIVWLF